MAGTKSSSRGVSRTGVSCSDVTAAATGDEDEGVSSFGVGLEAWPLEGEGSVNTEGGFSFEPVAVTESMSTSSGWVVEDGKAHGIKMRRSLESSEFFCGPGLAGLGLLGLPFGFSMSSVGVEEDEENANGTGVPAPFSWGGSRTADTGGWDDEGRSGVEGAGGGDKAASSGTASVLEASGMLSTSSRTG